MKNSQSLYSMITNWMNWEQQIEFATTDMYSTNDTPPVYGEQGWQNESEWQSKRDDEKNWVLMFCITAGFWVLMFYITTELYKHVTIILGFLD